MSGRGREAPPDVGPIDLVSLDARIGRASMAVDRSLAELRRKKRPATGVAAAAETPTDDPFGALRNVAGQSMFRALSDLEVGELQKDHKQGLLRWVYELLQTRVGWDLIVAEVDAMRAPDPTLSRRLQLLMQARPPPEEGSTTPSEAKRTTTIVTTYDEALSALIDGEHASHAAITLERMTDLAPPVHAVRKELRIRRFEAARRLGLTHPWDLVSPPSSSSSSSDDASTSITKTETLARGLLDATEPLARAQHKDRKQKRSAHTSASSGPIDGPAGAIHDSFARDTAEGWPARLNARWFEDVFRALTRGRPPQNVRLPSAVGGASFLRAASSWGSALRLSGTARSLPFALARDPYPVEAYAFGGALASCVADRVFAKKKLGLPARSGHAHARALGWVLFVELRRLAATLLTQMRETIAADEIEEMSARIFGSPLPNALGAAWAHGGFSGASRVDAPTRFLGAMHAHKLVRSLVDRYDEDWFDNPRCGRDLGGMSVGPVRLVPTADDSSASANANANADADAVTSIARAFEELLG